MRRPPRPPDEPILDRIAVVRTVIVSSLIAGSAFGLFWYADQSGDYTVEQARTIAANTIIVVEVGYLFACRSLRLPIWRLGWFTNPWVWVGATLTLLAQLAFTYLPVMNELFHTQPIPLWWWGAFTAAGGLVFVVVEIKKALTAS